VFSTIKEFFLSKPTPLIIVSASDSSHYNSLMNFLNSAFLYESYQKLVVYDLGLTACQLDTLKSKFSNILVRSFDFSLYPEFLNIKINAGEYAWKPIIINNLMNEFNCDVCWMDAGNIITSKLIKLRKILDKYGFYSPYSQGTIKDWTFTKTLTYLGASSQLLSKPNLNGACVAFSATCSASRALLKRWAECALIKACIAPEGSNRSNHRQDQAVLTVLAYQNGIMGKLQDKVNLNCYFGFKIHQDVD